MFPSPMERLAVGVSKAKVTDDSWRTPTRRIGHLDQACGDDESGSAMEDITDRCLFAVSH